MPIGNTPDRQPTKIAYAGDQVWANNAPINTEKTIDITFNTKRMHDILILIKHPSTITDLTVKVQDTMAGPTYCLKSTFGVAKGGTNNVSILVEKVGGPGALDTTGLQYAGVIRISLFNDTALGAAEGFTAHVVVLTEDDPV